jgi:hypothetical protein
VPVNRSPSATARRLSGGRLAYGSDETEPREILFPACGLAGAAELPTADAEHQYPVAHPLVCVQACLWIVAFVSLLEALVIVPNPVMLGNAAV